METLEVHSSHQCNISLSHGLHRPDVIMFDMGIESIDGTKGGSTPIPATCNDSGHVEGGCLCLLDFQGH